MRANSTSAPQALVTAVIAVLILAATLALAGCGRPQAAEQPVPTPQKEVEPGRAVAIMESAMGAAESVHLPSPSYWPFVLALGLVVSMLGVIFFDKFAFLPFIGLVIFAAGFAGWIIQPAD